MDRSDEFERVIVTLDVPACIAAHTLLCTSFMPIASLKLASPAALAICQRRSLYVRSASVVSIAIVASLAVFVGAGYVGPLCATLAAPILVALCFAAPRSRWVQRTLERHAVQRARAQRESARRRALCWVTVPRREQYTELRVLVECIERFDPIEARRLELEELLDHFVQLAVGHERCTVSLRVAGGSEPQATTPISEKPPTKRRRDITARRLRHREEITAQLGRIADEIDSAEDLIRLVAQRTACANLDMLIDDRGEIDRRLAELDAVEAALVQISA